MYFPGRYHAFRKIAPADFSQAARVYLGPAAMGDNPHCQSNNDQERDNTAPQPPFCLTFSLRQAAPLGHGRLELTPSPPCLLGYAESRTPVPAFSRIHRTVTIGAEC
ncbi:hypothetical protein ACPOL_5122 [Acidisarcina polymorpha]|uniref:Uncharacterized protein n=1 Tax=Acidisarcina polymorpha TaxID=2211140 RepID=A0A2Z5G5J8_9BACT|nr:hypothetical protein ACPOL_5122 [Acidisarcina polymorpha]